MMTPIELVAKSWNRKVMSLEDGIIWKRHVDQLLFKDDSTETVSTWEYPSSVTPSEDQSNLEQSTCSTQTGIKPETINPEGDSTISHYPQRIRHPPDRYY